MTYAENKTGIKLLDYINVDEAELCSYQPVSSAYAIIKAHGKLLLGFNIWRKQWEFPAGKIENGETPREAAIRELAEETHQEVADLSFKGLFRIVDTRNHEFRYGAVYYGELTAPRIFEHQKDDEMEKITFWDTKQDIGYVDEVDIEMFELINNALD